VADALRNYRAAGRLAGQPRPVGQSPSGASTASGDGISGEAEKPAAPKRWNPWVPPGVAWRALTTARRGHPWLLAGAGLALGALTLGTLPGVAVGLLAGIGANRLIWR
jgi:hypothetical protein